MERQTRREDYRTVQWNFLGPHFHLKIDAFYSCIDHGVRSNFLLENIITQGLFCWIWKCFYVLDDLFLCYHKRSSSIQNLFQKLSIFKTECSSSEIWDCQWHKTFSVTPVFTTLILLLFFKLSNINVMVLLLLIFYFFLLSPMLLRLVK